MSRCGKFDSAKKLGIRLRGFEVDMETVGLHDIQKTNFSPLTVVLSLPLKRINTEL